MLTQQAIIDFCNQYDYDIRKSHNGRWIDQKCAADRGQVYLLLLANTDA